MLNKVKGSALLIVLLVLALALAGGMFYFFQQERNKAMNLQTELEDIKTKQKALERELSDSRSKISSLEGNLRDANVKIDTLTQSLEEEKSAKTEALNKMEAMKADLDKQKNFGTDLEAKLSKAQKDMDKMKTQLRDLDARRIELENKIKQLEASNTSSDVELGKIVVGSESANAGGAQGAAPAANTAASQALQDGKVLVINKDYNFAVINLGSRDGVQVGQMFSVYQGGKAIGDVKIEKIHDSMSAAGFVGPDLKNKIREGDKVVLKK